MQKRENVSFLSSAGLYSLVALLTATSNSEYFNNEPNVLSVCFGLSVCTVFRTAGNKVMTALVRPAGRLLAAGSLPSFSAAQVWLPTPKHSRLIHNPALRLLNLQGTV